MSEKHVDRLTSSPSGRTDTLSMEEIQKLSDSSLARYILKQLQFYIDEEAPPGHVQRDQDFLAAMFAEVRRQSLSLESVRSEALEWIIGWTFRHDVALSVEARNELASALQSTARVAEGGTKVQHDWQPLTVTPETYRCQNCGCWTANLPLYKDEVCEARECRFSERRKSAPESPSKEQPE